MSATYLSNLVNPEVFSDLLNNAFENELKFAPLAIVDDTLSGQAGDTVKLPSYSYIGDAEDVAEGESINISELSASPVSVKIKKAGKGVELTDEAALSGYGDPIGTAASQLKQSIAKKMDADCYNALCEIGEDMTVGDGSSALSADTVADALVKFGQNLEGEKVLLISPKQLADLRKDASYIMPCDMGAAIMAEGTVGSIHGCQVVISDKIVKDENGFYTNFIVKPGAIAVFLKRDINVETARDIVKKTTTITADKHYAAYLANPNKAIKIVSGEAN